MNTPAELRNLSGEQQTRVRDLAGRVGADIHDPTKLNTLIRASETFSDNDFSRDELNSRTADYIKLGGATDEQVGQVLDLYAKNNLLPPRGEVSVGEILPGDTPMAYEPQTPRPSAFGSPYVDDALVGAGNVFNKIGQTINDNPIAKYALIGLDVVAGPVAFGARQAIEHSPLGDLKHAIEERVADYSAGKLVEANRDVQQAELGGVGTVGLIEMVGGGALAGLRKAVNALENFAARGVLRRNLGITDADYAAHHLIPVAEARESAAIKHAIENLGYDINRVENGIALPSNVNKALQTGELLHSGSHPDYSKLVRGDIASLDTVFKAGKLSNNDLMREISRIENSYRALIESKAVQLSKRDPNFP